MPFKLKLKKTRQYNVASKNLFVISVELLDGGIADCTLSVDSTGQECLDNVCQRQAINQPEFFGLRYINRSQQPRWVQLERPLKRQLDKYASSHQLYLRVMYYIISGTSLITDEVTRYHYFLQLKNDLIEGRIICDCQQAVVLASYSRQAEYGNHDQERHTVDYLKNLLTFPKQMIDGEGQLIDGNTLAETGRLEWLTAAVIQHHMSLHNMSQAQAEEGFITACQQLRGFGQEMFLAREQNTQAEVTIAVSISGITVLNDTTDNPHFYRWTDITNVINHKRTFSIECAKACDSACFQLPTPEDGKYVWRVCVQQHTFFMSHQPKHPTPGPIVPTAFQEQGVGGGQSVVSETGGGGGPGVGGGSLQRAHSTPCLELEPRHNTPHSVHAASRQLLPSYRPAPDYETAIQQKYQQQRAEAQLRFQNHSHTQLVTNKPMAYGSHPDIHRIHYPDVTRHTVNHTDDYQFGLKYLPHNYATFAVNPNVQTELNPQLHYVNVYKPPPPYPSGVASNSTPDLAVASQAMNYNRSYIASHVSGSSPDLVSNRSAINRQFLGYVNGNVLVNYQNLNPSTHGTYSNLNSVLDVANTHRHIQKVHDDRGNIMYSMPMRDLQYQRHNVIPQTTKRNEHEPIYENVPLPWRERGTLRDRAHSLTTTDEINRLNERNASHPTINKYIQPNQVPNYPQVPSIKIDTPDSHYVNAQIIKVVRESSVPKETVDNSNRLINNTSNIYKDGFDNVVLSMEKASIDSKEYDETPYQSLSTHKVNNNTVFDKSSDPTNITSISVPDIRHDINSNSSVADSALASSIMNSTYSTTDLELSGNTTKSSVASKEKEKKRRRWGVFIGRSKDSEVKSATLGRDKNKVKNQAANKNRWSTGLPKFQPLPPSITKETLCQLLERKMSDDQLAFAFEQIPKGRASNCEMTTALLPQYSYLNGHSTEALPYEDNRVKLQSSVHNPHGYVNASHITLTVGPAQQFYVVMRLPAKVNTRAAALDPAALFWRACWQVAARVAVTTKLPYLVPSGTNTTVQYGELSVKVESVTAAAWGSTRLVSLGAGAGGARGTGGAGGTHKHVWLLEHALWDVATPAPTADTVPLYLDLISEINTLCAMCNGSGMPLVVACAGEGGGDGRGEGPAGVQRAPLLLTAHLLLHVLDHNQELDIPRTVSLLHQQRANMIQNVHQYKFLHEVLLHYLRQSRLI